MAGKMLSATPALEEAAELQAATFGTFCEVRSRTKLLEVSVGECSRVASDSQITYAAIGKFCSIAAMARIGPGNHPMKRAPRAHFTDRAIAYCSGEAGE